MKIRKRIHQLGRIAVLDSSSMFWSQITIWNSKCKCLLFLNFPSIQGSKNFEQLSRQPKKREKTKSYINKMTFVLTQVDISVAPTTKNPNFKFHSVPHLLNFTSNQQTRIGYDKSHTLWSPPPVANLSPPGWTSMEKICIPSCLIQLGFSAIISASWYYKAIPAFAL
jgi:hypothetical protein